VQLFVERLADLQQLELGRQLGRRVLLRHHGLRRRRVLQFRVRSCVRLPDCGLVPLGRPDGLLRTERRGGQLLLRHERLGGQREERLYRGVERDLDHDGAVAGSGVCPVVFADCCARSHLGRFKTIADYDWNWPTKIDRPLVSPRRVSGSVHAPRDVRH
jgi:hypothetical protein